MIITFGGHRKRVYRLHDRHDAGYASFGYGGDKLYLAWESDCFDPPIYVIRADCIGSAYEVLLACLATEVQFSDLSDEDKEYLAEDRVPPGCDLSPDGRLVYSEALHLVEYKRESRVWELEDYWEREEQARRDYLKYPDDEGRRRVRSTMHATDRYINSADVTNVSTQYGIFTTLESWVRHYRYVKSLEERTDL